MVNVFMEKLTQRLYEACLTATGAYEALKLAGAHNHLPGYDRCLRDLNKVIAEYEAASQQANTPDPNPVTHPECGMCKRNDFNLTCPWK